jgi:hypothetical protein
MAESSELIEEQQTSGSSEPALLRAIGEALYGAYWQNQLAFALGVNRVSIQRWLRGEWRPRPGVWVELERMLSERAAAQQGLIEAIRGRGTAPFCLSG